MTRRDLSGSSLLSPNDDIGTPRTTVRGSVSNSAQAALRLLGLRARGDERAGAGARVRLARPGDAEAAALVLPALDVDLAAEQFDDAARNRQAQADAVVRTRQAVVHLPEAVEDVGQRVARNPYARVGDFNIPPVGAFRARAHRHAPRRG